MRSLQLLALMTVHIVVPRCWSQQGWHTGHMRTNGFYVYDNGIDTLCIIPDGMEMQVQMIHHMQDIGYIDKHKTLTHNDSLAKDGERSTAIDCIAFFNDTAGTVFGTIYRTDTVVKELLATIQERKAKLINEADRQRFAITTDVHFLTDSTFTFSRTMVLDDSRIVYHCTQSGSLLKVSSGRAGIPEALRTERIYTFVPFDNIPQDLCKPKTRR